MLPNEPNTAASIIEYPGGPATDTFAGDLPKYEDARVAITCRSTSSVTARANAALIAAAPDMYAALECILNLASTPAANGELVYIDFMEIRAALAKARGES